jgi:hypothetical protein
MRHPEIPTRTQLTAIATALEQVDAARAILATAKRTGADPRARHQAHADLRAAYQIADDRLREVTTELKQRGQRSFVEWSHWRSQLSSLDNERQVHLLDEVDDHTLRPLGSVRAVDTGMSGPAIGELQHGDSVPPGTPARYGLDMDALLSRPQRVEGSGGRSGDHVSTRPRVRRARRPRPTPWSERGRGGPATAA